MTISIDTQVALLLTSRLREPEGSQVETLRPSELAKLVKELGALGLSLGDLFEPANVERVCDAGEFASERLSGLLGRGLALAMATDRWAAQGIWVIGWSDPDYPERYKTRLKGQAPPLIYGVGDISLLSKHGLGAVGSREIDEPAIEFTRRVAASCADHDVQVISGGARGVDSEAMLGCIEHGGHSVGILADSLSRNASSAKAREAIVDGSLLLISPFEPEARFYIGSAMARNKLIYTLSDFTLVVSSDYEKGGTWTGATENLDKHWVPLFVRSGDDIPQGNLRLIDRGGIPLDQSAANAEDLILQMQRTVESIPDNDDPPGTKDAQLSLF